MNTRCIWLLFCASCASAAVPRTPVDSSAAADDAPATVVVRGDLTATLLGLSVARSRRPADPGGAPRSLAGTFVAEGTSIWLEVRPKAGRVLRIVSEDSTILAISDDRGRSLLGSRSRITPGVVVDDGGGLVVAIETAGLPGQLARRVLARVRLTIEVAAAERVVKTTLAPGETRGLETPIGVVRMQRSDAAEDGGDWVSGRPRGPSTTITIDDWNKIDRYVGEPRVLGLAPNGRSQTAQLTDGALHQTQSFSFPRTDQTIEVELPVRVPVRQQLEIEVSTGLGLGPPN